MPDATLPRFRRKIRFIAVIATFIGLLVIFFALWSYITGFHGRTFTSPDAVTLESHRALVKLYSIMAFMVLPLIGVFLITMAYGLITEVKTLAREWNVDA